jgi:hypothetical protein
MAVDPCAGPNNLGHPLAAFKSGKIFSDEVTEVLLGVSDPP